MDRRELLKIPLVLGASLLLPNPAEPETISCSEKNPYVRKALTHPPAQRYALTPQENLEWNQVPKIIRGVRISLNGVVKLVIYSEQHIQGVEDDAAFIQRIASLLQLSPDIRGLGNVTANFLGKASFIPVDVNAQLCFLGNDHALTLQGTPHDLVITNDYLSLPGFQKTPGVSVHNNLSNSSVDRQEGTMYFYAPATPQAGMTSPQRSKIEGFIFDAPDISSYLKCIGEPVQKCVDRILMRFPDTLFAGTSGSGLYINGKLMGVFRGFHDPKGAKIASFAGPQQINNLISEARKQPLGEKFSLAA